MEAEGGVELREICTLEGHTDRVWSLAWNPVAGGDGGPALLASCSGDKTVRIWRQNLATDSWECAVYIFSRLDICFVFLLVLDFCVASSRLRVSRNWLVDNVR